jgi:hypothetical protein
MGEVERLFHQLDKSGDGTLDRGELRALSHRLFGSHEDGTPVADPADIDGDETKVALSEALALYSCEWDAERDGLGLVCTPDDFNPRQEKQRVRRLKTRAEEVVERLLARKEADKSFASKLRDADTAFRTMLDDINAADTTRVTRAEFSQWWKQIGSQVQQQQQQSGEPGEAQYELEVRPAPPGPSFCCESRRVRRGWTMRGHSPVEVLFRADRRGGRWRSRTRDERVLDEPRGS